MRLAYILILIGLLVLPISNASHSITMHFGGECPPDNEVFVYCFDLTGVVHIASTMPICTSETYTVPNDVGTLICLIECNGEEAYRKRYEFPGTPWKAPPGYPYDIARFGDLPEDEDISDEIDETITSPDKCGNGDIEGSENCDTNGDNGCDDPLKPTCYDCKYCGCDDASQCQQISGSMECGSHGCPPYTRPSFSVECRDGMCLNPRKCNVDQDCIDKHQDSLDKENDSEVIRLNDGSAAMGNEQISNAVVEIESETQDGDMKIMKIRYSLWAESDISISPGEGLREHLDEPEGMLVPFWDIKYDGLSMVEPDLATEYVDYEGKIPAFLIDSNDQEFPDCYGMVSFFGASLSEIEDGKDYAILVKPVDSKEDDSESNLDEDDLQILDQYPIEGTGSLMKQTLSLGENVQISTSGDRSSLFFPKDSLMFVLELDFTEGISDGIQLEKLEGNSIFILGQPFVILSIETDEGIFLEAAPWNMQQDSTIEPPPGIPPGEPAHLICAEVESCVWEQGEGEDECHHCEDCTTERMEELEKDSKQRPEEESSIYPGTSYHATCGPGGYCIRAEGKGTDDCVSDGDCSDQNLPMENDMHTECKDKLCTYVEGEGTDECGGHWNCDQSYPYPSTRASTCFGIMCRINAPGAEVNGMPCRTDADCKGIGLFSGLFGADLNEDVSLDYVLRQIIGDERVNLYAGNEKAFVVIRNGTVSDRGNRELPDNSVNVMTDIATIEDIESGNITFEEAYYNDRIKVGGEGFFNGIRYWFSEMVFDLFYDDSPEEDSL